MGSTRVGPIRAEGVHGGWLYYVATVDRSTFIMSNDMRPYVVRQGDHLSGLAARFGFDAQQVWQHADNEEVREARPNPEVLSPGDILFIPEPDPEPLPLEVHTTNRYAAPQPRIRLGLSLRGPGNEPLANEPYRLEGIPRPVTGNTDGDGFITDTLPAHTRSVRVVLPNLNDHTFLVQVGHLNPTDEPSGLEAQLRGLGYLPSLAGLDEHHPRVADPDADAEALQAAVRAFQRDHDIEETGEADAATIDAIHEEGA